jgi:hypothetical protein
LSHITMPGPLVSMTFCVDGAVVHEFAATPAAPLPMNVAADAASAGGAAAATYSYAYTGRHDDGPLPPMREGGHYALLARAVIDAKAESDRFLTARMAAEAPLAAAPKRARVEDRP